MASRCNGTNHKPDQCKYKDATCNKCGRKGHISPACNQQQRLSQQLKKQRGRAKLHQVEEEEIDIDSLFKLDVHDTGTNREPIWLQPIVNGRKVRMELDTGSGVSIIPMEMKDTLFPKDTVYESDLKLKYSNETLLPEGYIKCKVNIHGQEKDLKLYVMRKGKVPLFGREWLYALKLDWTEIWNLNLDRVAQLKNKYKDVFDRDLGKVKDLKAKLKLKPASKPKFVKARSVPFAMEPQIEEELDRLVKDGVLEKVDTSEWATPIVPVPKKEGIRICGDFKVTINPLMEVDQHPLPKIEDLFASLGKGKSFSKIDLINAYLHVEIDEDSKQYLTTSTHKGLFRYNRLVFGIASAPAIFQRLIEQVVGDIPNVEVILDDMIVTGQDDNEHLETLEKVLSRLSEYGLKVNAEKCAFIIDKVLFCGHEITKDGLHKTTEKINAIKDAPPIKNVRDLRSFLGLVHPSKGISATTAARLQRYALFLSGYQYDIVYRYTKQHGNCDSLSRLPLETSNVLEADETDVFFSKQLDTLPFSSDQVALETKCDIILSNVLEYVAKGKPMNSYHMSAVYQPFMNRQSQISVHQGCLMWGLRVVIPYSLRNSAVQELHSGHLGIVKMKSLVRSYVWWPGIVKDLEGIAQSCYGCLTAKPSPPEAPIHPWEYLNRPWTRVHVDFAGPFMGHMFLVIVGSYSKWPIVKIMNKTSTRKTIEILRATFAEFGLCDELDSVLIRDYRDNEKWIPGVVKTKTGPVSYNVEIYTGVTWRRHADQLRAANVTPAGSPEIFIDPVIPSTQSKSSVESSGPTSPQKAKVTTLTPKEPPPVVELRRSSRTVKKCVLMDL
ncbi:uncharacterized protein K02A2.6-like [Mercenaria mercenaria]|uniref:uncharacterized protein K02A2.6-like n=1 Tax=Mercenaria mercenaria TaxID=6596 RepID=UPI00234E4CED|nr:uncharacterized protein K02A2.6-like [Mercenaria mercenaria]